MKKVLVTGSSGFVGRALVPALKEQYQVVRLVRRPAEGDDEVFWDPMRGEIDTELCHDVWGVVNLAGENIASGFWTARKKQRIRDSRVKGTELLVKSLRPNVLVNASAIGYYGNRGEELLTEESGPGVGFLAEVCRDWEAAAKGAEEACVRVVRLRIGVVLHPDGGALGRMLGPFRAGLGGKVGTGRQWMSWIGRGRLHSRTVSCGSN